MRGGAGASMGGGVGISLGGRVPGKSGGGCGWGTCFVGVEGEEGCGQGLERKWDE